MRCIPGHGQSTGTVDANATAGGDEDAFGGIGSGCRVVAHSDDGDHVRAALASRSPNGLSLWRCVLPLLAGIGFAAHRAANADSERSRSGLPPAVTTSWPACSVDVRLRDRPRVLVPQRLWMVKVLGRSGVGR